MVPIFWPLSVLWALIQLPAWLPAQDGHGKQQALCRGRVGKGRDGFPSAAWVPPPKPLRAQRLGTDAAAPPPPSRPPPQPHRVLPLPSPSGYPPPRDKVSSLLHIVPTYYACMLSQFSRVQLFATPWTVACQVPMSVGYSRQEY